MVAIWFFPGFIVCTAILKPRDLYRMDRTGNPMKSKRVCLSHLVRRHKSLCSRQLLWMLSSKLNWRRQVLWERFFHWNCVAPLHGLLCLWEWRICTPFGNHEAKARGQQLEEAMRLTEEKYKELQAGQYVECWSSVELCQFMSSHVKSFLNESQTHNAETTWIQVGQNLTTPWMQVWMWLLPIFWEKGESPANSANPSPRERNARAASSRGT